MNNISAFFLLKFYDHPFDSLDLFEVFQKKISFAFYDDKIQFQLL